MERVAIVGGMAPIGEASARLVDFIFDETWDRAV